MRLERGDPVETQLQRKRVPPESLRDSAPRALVTAVIGDHTAGPSLRPALRTYRSASRSPGPTAVQELPGVGQLPGAPPALLAHSAALLLSSFHVSAFSRQAWCTPSTVIPTKLERSTFFATCFSFFSTALTLRCLHAFPVPTCQHKHLNHRYRFFFLLFWPRLSQGLRVLDFSRTKYTDEATSCFSARRASAHLITTQDTGLPTHTLLRSISSGRAVLQSRRCVVKR